MKFAGTLYSPERQPPYPAIVVVHPASGGERTNPFYDHLRSKLPEHGIAVLVFDRRGSGASEGDFATADFEDLANDVIAVVEYLQSRPDITPNKIGLHGTSQGAWIAPIAAARKPDIACVVAVSASGVSPADQMNYGVAFHLERAGFDLAVAEEAIRLRDLVNAYFRGQVSREEAAAELSRFEHESWYEQGYLYPSRELPADITRSKWHYEMDYEPLSIWKKVTQPTLFLFAEVDEWVPIRQSMLNYENGTTHLQDVTLRQIAGTDHLMRNQAGEISGEYLDVLLDWLKSRLATMGS
ncbi:MAG TPA: alpha/beta fold hydrolase [Anaerolineales bacterium]|nr:alpha/beta fold hydrolase [Anaerolineales bacterium]